MKMSTGTGMNVGTLAVLVTVIAGATPHLREAHWTPARVAGATLCVFSLGMIVVARFQLGAAFSVRAKAQRLVTTGVYAKIRNPIYVFGQLVFVGVALMAERWWLLLPAVLLVPLQMWRARNEARVLRAAFGEEYERYRERTWF